MSETEYYTIIIFVIIYVIIILNAFFTYLRNWKERKLRWELHEIERKAANEYHTQWVKILTGVDFNSEPKIYESTARKK